MEEASLISDLPLLRPPFVRPGPGTLLYIVQYCTCTQSKMAELELRAARANRAVGASARAFIFIHRNRPNVSDMVVSPHMHVPRGLAPPTHSWARTLRGSETEAVPGLGTAPRKPPPPLDTGFGPRRPSTAPQQRLTQRALHTKPVNMRGLASHARSWRRDVSASLLRALRRWRSLARRRRRPALPEALLVDATRLAERCMHTAVARRVATWRSAAAAQILHAQLVDLYLPHSKRRRAAAALSWLRSHVIIARWHSDVSSATYRRSASRRMLFAFENARHQTARDSVMGELASTAHDLSRPPTERRRAAYGVWRRRTAADAYARGLLRLGTLTQSSAGLRRGWARWRQAAATAAAAWGRYQLGVHAHGSRALRHAFDELRLRVFYELSLYRPLPAVDGQPLRWASRRSAGERAATIHGRRLRLAEALGVLRRAATSAQALDWAVLHAETRGQRRRARAALRHWNSATCGPTTASGLAVARLARVYALQLLASRRAVYPCDMAMVLREARLP